MKKKFPRDGAGSLDLQGGTGGIAAMCACGDFLEELDAGQVDSKMPINYRLALDISKLDTCFGI